MGWRAGEYPRIMWVLFGSAVIFATGMAFLWPLTTIYVHEVLGKSLTVASVVLLFNQGGFLAGSLIGGMLFDRWGKRKTLIMATLLAAVASLGMGLWQEFWLFTVLLFLNGFASGVVYPALNALAAWFWPEGERRGLNLVYVGVNVGVALGSALGGLIASITFAWTFYGNVMVQLLVLLLFVWMLAGRGKNTESGANTPAVERTAASGAGTAEPDEPKHATALAHLPKDRTVALGLLGVGLLFCWIVYVQWQTNLSAYIQGKGVSLAQYSLLWTLNGAMILCGQPLTAWIIRRFARSLKAQILLGSYIFVLSFLVLSQTTVYTGFFAAMLIMTLGEMLVWPAVPTIAAQMAPRGREGWYQGVVSGASSAGRMIGPLLGALLLEASSPLVMILVMIGICLLAVLSFGVYDRLGPRLASKISLSE